MSCLIGRSAAKPSKLGFPGQRLAYVSESGSKLPYSKEASLHLRLSAVVTARTGKNTGPCLSRGHGSAALGAPGGSSSRIHGPKEYTLAMRDGSMRFAGLLGLALLSIVGCRQASGPTPISLEKLGGKLTLRLNVKAGDKFAYEEVTRSVVEFRGRQTVQSTTEKVENEVLGSSSNEVRFAVTQTEADVASDDERLAAKTRDRRAVLQGVRVEIVYGPTAARKSLKVVSTNPSAQKRAADLYGTSPGLFGIVFPAGPIAVGAEWKATYDCRPAVSILGVGPAAAKSLSAVPVRYRLVGAEEDAGRTLAIVKYDMAYEFKVPEPSGSRDDTPATVNFTDSGRARIDVSTGMVYRDEDSSCLSGPVRGIDITVTSQSRNRMVSGR